MGNPMPLYRKIAIRLNAYQNCVKSGNTEWKDSHYDMLMHYINELPHGSGIDGKTLLDIEKSTPNKLIIYIEYHNMDENGFYDGWYNYKIVVTPSLQNGIDVTVIGKNTPNDAKEYLWQVFYDALIDTESN